MRGHKRKEIEMCHSLENGERIEKIKREKSYTHNSNYNVIENEIEINIKLNTYVH